MMMMLVHNVYLLTNWHRQIFSTFFKHWMFLLLERNIINCIYISLLKIVQNINS